MVIKVFPFLKIIISRKLLPAVGKWLGRFQKASQLFEDGVLASLVVSALSF